MTTSNTSTTTSNKTTTVNQANPWPGLLSYREQDQEFFHGRDDESAELFRLVMRAPLTVLFGLSGLGKSSLLQAGLFPLARKQNILPIYIRLDFSPNHPDLRMQVRKAIASQTDSAGVEAPVVKEGETLWEHFHRKDGDFWTDRNRLMQPLLVFDQFEEIFTLGGSTADFDAFLIELSDLIEGRPPAALKQQLDEHPENAREFSFSRHYYKVLLSLREDFLPELEGLRERIPSITHNRMRLQRMNGAAALQVVAQARHLIEQNVAVQVVRFVAAADQHHSVAMEKLEVEPALLSVVCRELNNKRQQRIESYITADLLEGTQEEILSGFYERSIGDLESEVRAFIEDKLLTLSGYRDSVALENILSSPGITRSAIDLLMDRRLIRIEERAGIQRLELTHDLLTRVILASRNRRHLLESEQRQAKEITAKQKQEKLKERARHARRYRWLSVTLAMLCLLALFAFYSAGVQTKRAERQREEAELARHEALEISHRAQQAEEVANQRLQRITETVKLRQALLSKDTTALKEAFAKAAVETQLDFGATAKEYPYKSIGGLPTYRFQMFPVEKSRTDGFEGIAFITYIMDNPTFQNPHISTGPDTRFAGTYDGVGCLSHVTAVIEYSDVDKPLTIAQFNMCEKLGW